MEAALVPVVAAAGPNGEPALTAAEQPAAAPPEAHRLPLRVGHVVDYYRRYPGETVTFHTRVDVLRPASGFRLTIGLPAGLAPGSYQASSRHGDHVPHLAVTEAGHYLVWEEDQSVKAGERYEYRCEAVVAPTDQDLILESYALATTADADGDRAVETVAVAVDAKGRYLRHLPALYLDDELMGRFLMLFESFWRPITAQIDSIWHYFDPRLAPPDLLPWLARWIDLALDERWSEAKRRRLLGAAMSLFRKRGTKAGLHDYLEIYTGVKPRIVEHGAHNFRLGREARLGPAIALGTLNQPHTFTVQLALPRAEAEAEAEAARRQQEQRRIIEAIIEAEKPAHTAFNLEIQYDGG